MNNVSVNMTKNWKSNSRKCTILIIYLFQDELRALVKTEHEKIDAANTPKGASNTTPQKGASSTTPKKDTSVTTSKKEPPPETSKAPTKVTIPKKAETTPRGDPKSTTPKVDPKSTKPSPSSSKSSQLQKPMSAKKKGGSSL